MENDQLKKPAQHADRQGWLIKNQADVEDWLRSQCLIAGVDPMRVRIKADVTPLFDRDPQQTDFADDEQLFQAAQTSYAQHQWFYEQLTVSVMVHGVVLSAHSGIIVSGQVPARDVKGHLTSRTVLSYEDPLAEWLSLAAVAVAGAEQMLTRLRGVEVSWPAGEVSRSSPPETTSNDSPALS